MHKTAAILTLVVVLGGLRLRAQGRDEQVLEAGLRHLGNTTVREWAEFSSAAPEATSLELKFRGKENRGEHVLVFRVYNVHNTWRIVLNGKRVESLTRNLGWKLYRVVLPARSVKSGENVLEVRPTQRDDDIVIGEFVLHRKSLRKLLDLSEVRVRITDEKKRPIPAKLTITTADGEKPQIYYGDFPEQAVRKGIVYTGTGEANFAIPAGDYRLAVTRGFEWSRKVQKIRISAGTRLDLGPYVITREVDTTGFVACDTHIHTLTHSGHGDASMEERAVTLAAEGVELAVATDHNHNIDYRPVQEELGLHRHYTPVVGNEVTTGVGHMNAFPMKPDDRVPNHRLRDWVELHEEMRSKGALVTVLNHPRYQNLFPRFGFSRVTGEFAGGVRFPFDAIEVINSGSTTTEPITILGDWFALLNHGYDLPAVGSSDSHTVHDPVGQGRTYVKSRTDDPAKIDVPEACENIAAGRSSISLGIYCEVTFYGKGPGEMVTPVPHVTGKQTIPMRVRAPSWIRPRHAAVYLNGRLAAQRVIRGQKGQRTDLLLNIDVELPDWDCWLVCVAMGDAITDPEWPTLFPFTIGATNPMRLDVDSDGKWVAPRETGVALFAKREQPDRGAFRRVLAAADDGVMAGYLVAARDHFAAEHGDDPKRAREALLDFVGIPLGQREVIRSFVEGLPKVE